MIIVILGAQIETNTFDYFIFNFYLSLYEIILLNVGLTASQKRLPMQERLHSLLHYHAL